MPIMIHYGHQLIAGNYSLMETRLAGNPRILMETIVQKKRFHQRVVDVTIYFHAYEIFRLTYSI